MDNRKKRLARNDKPLRTDVQCLNEERSFSTPAKQSDDEYMEAFMKVSERQDVELMYNRMMRKRSHGGDFECFTDMDKMYKHVWDNRFEASLEPKSQTDIMFDQLALMDTITEVINEKRLEREKRKKARKEARQQAALKNCEIIDLT